MRHCHQRKTMKHILFHLSNMTLYTHAHKQTGHLSATSCPTSDIPCTENSIRFIYSNPKICDQHSTWNTMQTKKKRIETMAFRDIRLLWWCRCVGVCHFPAWTNAFERSPVMLNMQLQPTIMLFNDIVDSSSYKRMYNCITINSIILIVYHLCTAARCPSSSVTFRAHIAFAYKQTFCGM